MMYIVEKEEKEIKHYNAIYFLDTDTKKNIRRKREQQLIFAAICIFFLSYL